MTNFVQVGDRWINLATVIKIDHHREEHAIKLTMLNGSTMVLTDDDAQSLLLHLEVTHEKTMRQLRAERSSSTL
jgi:hypothetical protein